MKRSLVFVNGHLGIGGVERALVDLLRSLDYDRFDVDLVLFEDPDDYRGEIPAAVRVLRFDVHGDRLHALPAITRAVLARRWITASTRAAMTLQRLVGVEALAVAAPAFPLRRRYDVGIAFRMGFCAEFLAMVVHADRKLAWWHSAVFDLGPSQFTAMKRTVRRLDRVVAVSASSRNLLARHLPSLEKKLCVIPNIVPLVDLERKSLEQPSTAPSPDRFVLVSVGRLSAEKAFIDCVSTCRSLVDAGHRIRWYLIGEGPERGSIENAIRDQGLTGDFFLLGGLANPYPDMARANLFVHPSPVESFSITILEALALGLPAVVVRSSGPAEYLVRDTDALLIDSGSEAMFRAIDQVMRDPTLLQRLRSPKTNLLDAYLPSAVVERFEAQLGA